MRRFKASFDILPDKPAPRTSTHGRVVPISGEEKERREEDEKGYAYSERSYGAFERRIELPPSADEKSIKAKVRNGVLEITVPKKPEPAGQRKRIEI